MPGAQAGVVDPDEGVQLSVKINDPGSNGGTRYKAPPHPFPLPPILCDLVLVLSPFSSSAFPPFCPSDQTNRRGCFTARRSSSASGGGCCIAVGRTPLHRRAQGGAGQDYATFLVPQACLAPADRERRNKVRHARRPCST
eukprot:751957-Hanusia_phi.AAC.2